MTGLSGAVFCGPRELPAKVAVRRNIFDPVSPYSEDRNEKDAKPLALDCRCAWKGQDGYIVHLDELLSAFLELEDAAVIDYPVGCSASVRPFSMLGCGPSSPRYTPGFFSSMLTDESGTAPLRDRHGLLGVLELESVIRASGGESAALSGRSEL